MAVINYADIFGSDFSQIKTLNTDLEKVANIQKEIHTQSIKNREALNNYNNERREASNAIRNVNENTKKLSVTEKELLRIQRASEKITEETAIAQAKLTEKRRRYREEANKTIGVQKKSNGFFRKMKGSILAAGAAFAGIGAAIGLFIRGLGSAIKTVVQFDKSIAELAGIMGKSRAEIRPLIESAKEFGATTAKSASEVIKLQQAYARLGFTQQEIINLTGGTINGSIALNAELEDTAALTGAVVNSFDDLKTTDADKILDTLTLSTQKSATNFSYLSTAIPIAAGAANGANVPFEKMVDQLGQAADRGIDASTAATSLRNIYLELAKKGLTLEQALAKINGSQDKLSVANELFGKRATVTALALAANANEATKFEKALDGVGGTAKRVADQQLDTIHGDVTLLKSAWEGLILSFESGDGFLAKIGRGAIQALTKLITGVTKFRNNFVENFNDLIRESTTFRTAISVMANVTKLAFKAMITPTLILIDAFKGLGNIIVDILKGDFKNIKNSFNEGLSDIKGRVNNLGDAFVASAKNIKSAFKGENVEQFLIGVKKVPEEIAETFDESTKVVKQNLDQQTEAVEKATEKEKRLIEKYLDETTKRREDAEELMARLLLERNLREAKSIEESRKLQSAYEQERFDALVERLEAEQALLDLKDEKQLERSRVIDEEIENLKLEHEANMAEIDKEAKAEQAKREDEQRELIADNMGYVQDLFNGVANLRGQLIDNEIASIERQRDAEVAAAEEAGRDTADIEKKYAEKEKQLRTKKAIAEKNSALFNAVINTAAAITRALPNVALSILAGALGGIQIAKIASQKIPAFKKGGEMLYTGFAKYSEEGREIKITPDGKASLTPDVTTFGLVPKGTKFIPHWETEQILQGGSTPERAQSKTSKSNIVHKNFEINGRNFNETIKTANSKINLEDTYYKL